MYIDRSYTYQTVPPALTGGTYLQTANGDKNSQGKSFLTFDVNQPVTVYAAHDQRITAKPSWLSAFTLTTTGWASSDTTFDVYEQSFPAGTVVLGGNQETATGKSMDTVAVIPTTP